MSEAAEKIQPLDWQRMFIGDTDPLFLLEITLRTSLIFVWFAPAANHRETRPGATQPAGTGDCHRAGVSGGRPHVLCCSRTPCWRWCWWWACNGLAHLIIRSERVETFVEGQPVELVRDGVMNWPGLNRTKLSREDLFEALRAQDVRQLGQVQRAYFEQDGHLSVFVRDDHEPAPPGLPVVPPWDLEPPPAAPAGYGVWSPACAAGACRTTRAAPALAPGAAGRPPPPTR